MKKHLPPVEYIIHAFKGVRPLSREIGVDASTISHWRERTKKNDGAIPNTDGRHKTILAAAARLQLDVTPNDLIYGRAVEAGDHETAPL